MKPTHSARRPASSAPGVKMLLTTGALAATMGGWAVLTVKQVQPTTADQPPPVVALSPAQPTAPPGRTAQLPASLRVVTAPPAASVPPAPLAITRSSR